MNNYELYHHGILGMKWGIRRFQNKDGSLTAAGKQRYSTDGENDGHTLKNRVKSALGIYKEGDGNPYVSEKRRNKRITEHKLFEPKNAKADGQDKSKTKKPLMTMEEYSKAKVRTNLAVSTLSSFGISALNDYFYTGKVNGETFIRGAGLAVLSAPITSLNTKLGIPADYDEYRKKNK